MTPLSNPRQIAKHCPRRNDYRRGWVFAATYAAGRTGLIALNARCFNKVRIRTGLLGLILLFTLGACTGIDLETANPPGFDLSGEWRLDAVQSDVVPDLRNAGAKPELAGRRGDRGRRTRPGSSDPFRGGRAALSFIAHDFQVLTAHSMIIEQGRGSMGVRYDPGVYRDVSWGERERGLWQVQAGWFEGDLLIISKAPQLQVQERFNYLTPDRLTVYVTIEADGEAYAYKREFSREK